MTHSMSTIDFIKRYSDIAGAGPGGGRLAAVWNGDVWRRCQQGFCQLSERSVEHLPQSHIRYGYHFNDSSASYTLARVVPGSPIRSLYYGDEIVRSAILFNVLLLALYILAIEFLVLQATSNSRSISLGAGLFAAFSYTTIYVFSRAWSETLFLVLILFGMIFVNMFLQQRRTRALLLSSGLFALAWLTRYVGITAIATGCIVILFWSGRRWKVRLRDAIIMAIIGSLPMSVLLLRNYLLTSSGANRTIGYHPPPTEWWLDASNTMAAWLGPASLPGTVSRLLTAIIIAAVLIGFYYTAKGYLSRSKSGNAIANDGSFLLHRSYSLVCT